MAETGADCLLIEMLPVRLPYAFAAQQAAAERDRRVGKKIERQDQGRFPVPGAGETDQQKSGQITKRHAADIAEKDARRCPVPHEKTAGCRDDRSGERSKQEANRDQSTCHRSQASGPSV